MQGQYELRNLNDNLQKWVLSQSAGLTLKDIANITKITDLNLLRRTLNLRTGNMIDKMLHQELDIAGKLTNASASELAKQMGGYAQVGKLLHDLDRYIGMAEVNMTQDMEASVVMARLMRDYLQDQVKIAQVSQRVPNKNRVKVVDKLNIDFAKMREGRDWEQLIDQTNSLATVLQSMVHRYPANSFQRKVAEFLANHARTNDIFIHTVTRQQAGPDTLGAYVFNNGTIEITKGVPVDRLLETIMHEATHVYTSRMSIRYKHYLADKANDPSVHYKDYGLSANEVRFLAHAEEILNRVRKVPVRDTQKYKELGAIPYGASFSEDDKIGIAEFLAELYSNKLFRNWVEDEITFQNKQPKRVVRDSLRKLADNFLSLFGINTSRDGGVALEQFLQFGFRYFDNGAWVTSAPGIKKLNSRQQGFNNTKNIRTRAETDFEAGVQYYTFKRSKSFGKPELAGSARYDDDAGAWEIQWSEEDGTVQFRDNLDIEEVMDIALANDLQVYGRSTLEGYGHWLDGQLDKIKMTHPGLGKMLEKFRMFLMNFLSESTANEWTGKLYEHVLWAEQYFLNRDALHTWIERALRAQGKDPESAARILNDIRSKTQTFMTERGLDEMTFHDHKVGIMELARQYGVNDKEFNDIVYALTAKHRKELFDKEPGEINPYTGKPVRDGSLVSGFMWKDANGVEHKDDDGSKYLAQLSTEKQRFAQELERKWIDQNNAVLDFERQAGAISDAQYYSQYGLFYAPLRNADDQATAFYKRALGRTTLAKDPATNYYNFAQARVQYAQHQMKMSALLDISLTENIQGILEVNQAHFTQNGAGLKKSWKPANGQDPAVITVWKGNVQYQMRITDPTIANFIIKADAREMTGVWKGIATATRALSAVRTSLSTTFVPAAFARDVLTAIGNVEAAFAELGSASLSAAESRELSSRVPQRAVVVAMDILNGTLRGSRSWQYDVFKRAGGGITMNARYDFEQVNDWLKSELRPATQGSQVKLGTGLKAAKKGIHKAMEISHAFEDAVRFATFMEYLEMKNGNRKFNNEQELISFLRANKELHSAAVTGSKRITGNFEVKGSNVGWRSAFMFFNASMVGLSTAVNMFNPRHGRHGLNFAMGLAGFMLASLAMNDADMGDDDDGKSKASRVREFGDKICFGGVCLQIPHEARFVTNAVTASYFYAKGDRTLGEATAQMMHGALQIGSPFQFDGFSTSGNQMHTLIQNLAPTLTELPIQLATGYNSFGKEIVSEYAYAPNGQRIMNAMDWQKTKMSDPEWTKWLAMNGQKWLGLDISSSEIDHTMQFILGSVYTTLKKTGSAIMNGGTPSDIFNAAVGRGFTMNYDNQAMINGMKEKIRQAKARLMLGDSTANMLRHPDELKNDPEYARLVALEKKVEKAEKELTFNGKSYSELFRQKQNGILTNNIDDILEANEGIDLLSNQRRELWGGFWEELDDIMGY